MTIFIFELFWPWFKKVKVTKTKSAVLQSKKSSDRKQTHLKIQFYIEKHVWQKILGNFSDIASFSPSPTYLTYIANVFDTCYNACVVYNPNKEAVFSRIVESKPSEIWEKNKSFWTPQKRKCHSWLLLFASMKGNYTQHLNSQLSQQTPTSQWSLCFPNMKFENSLLILDIIHWQFCCLLSAYKFLSYLYIYMHISVYVYICLWWSMKYISDIKYKNAAWIGGKNIIKRNMIKYNVIFLPPGQILLNNYIVQ